ncbi:MAG TPA: hypothetical protein VIM61_13835 [Chthoniobacterales bacterium]
MKTTVLSSVRILGLVVALAFTGQAFAGSTAKLAGTFEGDYTAAGSIPPYSGDSAGTTTAKFKATSGNKAGKLTLNGVDTKNGGATYSATLTFKSDGTATTTAIVPGLVDLAGTGTWKLAGNKIKFTFSASTPVGSIEAKGTIKVAGKKMTISSTGTASSIFGSGSGKYAFKGTR